MKNAVTLIVALLVSINAIFAQKINNTGLPYIRNFSPEEYQSSKQNWCAVQDFRGMLYIANTRGVLEYDGINWRQISTSKNSSVLALATQGNRIYVGGNSDIGYLTPDSTGTMQYTTLLNKIPEKYQNIKVYGITVADDGSVVFCSTSQIMHFDQDTMKILPIEGNSVFSYLLQHDGHIYVNHSAKGYCEFFNRHENPIMPLPGSDTLIDNQVVSILSENSVEKILATKELGIVSYSGDHISVIETPLNQELISSSIYCAITLKGGYYAFGTLKNGVIITDKDYNVIKRLNTATGVCDNQIISLYQDNDCGLWLLTGNGVSYVDLYSPLTVIPGIERVSSIGQLNDKVYLVGGDILYNINSENLKTGGANAFKPITLPKEKNQLKITDIEVIGDQVICGTSNGIIAVSSNGECYSADQTSSMVRTVIRPKNRNELLLCGNIGGLSVYALGKEGKWAKKHSIDEGYNMETRHIIEDTEGYFWVSKKETGVFRLEIDTAFKTVKEAKLYDETKGLASNIGNYIYEVGDDLVVASTSGFYIYDRATDTFKEYNKYNNMFNGIVESNYIYNDTYGKVWFTFQKTKRGNATPEIGFGYCNANDTVLNTELFMPYANRIYKLKEIGDSCYLLGTDKELLCYDSRIRQDNQTKFRSFIRRMITTHGDSLLFGGAFADQAGEIDSVQSKKLKIELPYSHNGVKFEYSANSYEHPEFTKFKIYLENNDADWSEWKDETSKEFNNLSPGSYTFMVKARNFLGQESIVAQISFSVLPPWYMSIWAYILYGLALAAVIYAFVKIYNRKLLKDKQRLERIVSERTAEIVEKNKEITEKNKSITDSINYASRIQKAMLPLDSRIQEALPEHFILFRPRDIVSGDFYWFAETADRIIITAADCTGHGVPGAFMSMVGAEILTTLVSKGIVESHDILTHQNRYIRKALNQDQTENHDGMDMALCSIDKKRKVVEFTGAKNPLIYISADGELVTVKADKQGIGGDQIEDDFHYTKNEIPVKPGTWYYLFSDGYQDQFGGPQHRKFMIKHMRELLLEIHNLPPNEQKEMLNARIEQWMKDGETEQTDDILVIGFKL